MLDPLANDSLLGHFQRHAQKCPEPPVYTFLDDGPEADTLSCAQLSASVWTVAARVHELALLLYPRGLEFICAFLACLAGVIAVPAYPNRKRGKPERWNGIIGVCPPTASCCIAYLRITRCDDA